MRLFLFIISISLSYLSISQGINNALMGSKSLSLGGSNAVYIKDASSSFSNPALTSLIENTTFTAGIGLLSSQSSFINSSFRSTQENSSQPLLIPFHIYGVYKIDDAMAVSLAINTPFGSGRKWEDEWTGRYITQDFRFKTQNFQPTFSYLIREDLSVGIGVVIARSSILFKNRMDYQNITQKFTANALGFGGNIGVWGKINQGTEYGVTFKTPINYKYKKGSTSLENVPLLLSSTITNSERLNTTYKTPYQISLAMSNRVMEKVYVTYQFDLDGWKINKEQVLDFENEEIPDLVYERNYKNSFAFRVGGEYLMNEQINFRGGFYYKETPVADEFISPEFPDGSALGYTAGGSYIASENISIDLAILYENQAKRTFLNDQHQFGGTMKTLNYGVVLGINYTL